MKEMKEIERKEPNKEEIQKILKQNILKLFAQIKKGCKRNICYNIYCANNIICKNSKYILYFIFHSIEYKNQKDEKILKDLIQLNEEMNNKYNTYDHFERFKCNENNEILEIEKKFENFSVEPNYDYAINLFEDEKCLPKINIDLSKLIAYYKNDKSTVDDLTKEISLFNQYFSDLTKSINLKNCESLHQKSIIYYLFYFMTRCFFYVCFHNNFIVSLSTAKTFQIFFNNFLEIINSVKLWLENDIKNSSMIINEENKNPNNKKFKKKINQILYESFSILCKYPNEFNEFILRCHNFLSIVLFSIDLYSMKDDREVAHIDENEYSLFQTFIKCFGVIHEINDYFSILDYKSFYNNSISKHLNLKRDFRVYIKNQKIRKKRKKEEKKKMSIDNNDNKNYNENDKYKIDISDDDDCKLEDDDDEEEEEIEKIKNKEDKIEFTMFDYIWLFSTSAKNEIIKLFNTRKQKLILSSSLTLNIRRDHLIEDTLNGLSNPDLNFQSKLRINFKGEKGIDQGGVSKEFFILLIRQIFEPNYGMFNYNTKTRLYWFNHFSFEPKIKYELIGTIFALAIYNNTILDVKLPICVYKKLLGIKPTLEDLKECDEELYNNLNFILNQNNPKLEEELDTNFTVVDDKFGEKIIIHLKPDGDKIMVNNENKEEYVKLYINWFFNKSIEEYFNCFEKGFYKIFHKSLINILTPEELELIICGTQYLDFYELKRVCTYENYDKNSESIKFFWEILLDFNQEEKKKFLSFVTGCDRAPIDGLGSLVITVSNGGINVDKLPTAHTCFNTLVLPDYKDKEKMKKALLTAINFSEGFGFA